MRPSLRIRLLGGFHVLIDGQPIPPACWRNRRAAAIVKLLSLDPTHRLHREQLMDTLWPDLTPPDQANNLRQSLHSARNVLESSGLPRDQALIREDEMIVLSNPETIWVDAVAFDRAVAAAWSGFSVTGAEAALALYAGDLLPEDRYDDWAEQWRAPLRASYLALLTRLAHHHCELGAFTDAIGVLQRVVAAEPTREAAYRTLLQAYAAIGHRDAALAQYDRLLLALAADGLAPEPETIDLAEQIRATRERSTPGVAPVVGSDHRSMAGDGLIGRERELAELRQLLISHRLVTLTGAGGVGKTRLALATSRPTDDPPWETSVFVDLAPLRSPDLVLSAIADALDVREAGGIAILEGITARISGRRLLLVIDNFEHVLQAGTLITRLLDALSGLRVLATSRVRLGLRDEREYRVEPLATTGPAGEASREHLPPAVALFVRRAEEAQPDFAYTDTNAAAIHAICRRLDGLPLAVELAAARVRVLTPAEILKRLERPLAILADTSRSHRPARQQTMRATIGWSVDLLSPAEQELFQQLGVFAGGWTLAAAEAIVSIQDHLTHKDSGRFSALDGLAVLVDQQLVTRHETADGELRFGMLEPIRESAAERLERSTALGALRDRHAAWFVQYVERAAPQLEMSDQAIWLARLDRDDDNIRVALRWLLDQGNAEPGLRMVNALRLHWFMRGRLIEGCEWTLAVASLPEARDLTRLRAVALIAAGFFAREYGDDDRAWNASREALSLSHRLGDRLLAADAMSNLGFVALQRGEYTDARDLFIRILATYREMGHQQGIADAVSFLGLTLAQIGDISGARARFEEALAIWGALDDRQALMVALPWLGDALVEQREYPAAFARYRQALDIARELQFEWGRTFAFDGLARIAIVVGDQQLALRLVSAAHQLRITHNIRPYPIDQRRADALVADLRLVLGNANVAAAFASQTAGPWHELEMEIITRLQPLVRDATLNER